MSRRLPLGPSWKKAQLADSSSGPDIVNWGTNNFVDKQGENLNATYLKDNETPSGLAFKVASTPEPLSAFSHAPVHQ